MQMLPKRLSHCVLSGELFEHGMEYVSWLDAEGNRKDYCCGCWASVEKRERGHFWRGKIPLKKEKITVPDAKALEYFRQESDAKKKFVLALYLQKKRQLFRRTQTLYEVVETGELFDVTPPLLTPEEGNALAQDLASCLHDT